MSTLSYPFSTTTLFGSTGVVGSHILNTLLSIPSVQTTTISRRAPKPASEPSPQYLTAIVDVDVNNWAPQLLTLSPIPHTVFSALGTTRAQAGDVASQWKIDHDLNVELAKAAKAAGVKTFVFISATGTRGWPNSSLAYNKMKNGVEDAIRGLEFENSIILKPGLIMGERKEGRLLEGFSDKVIRGIGKVSSHAQDSLAQKGQEIARAAVRAAEIAAEGKAPERYWVLEATDIVRHGRTEWQEKGAVANQTAL
ncbi:hypothetical protein EDB81DRAFT_871857 [Dactylonectria macrodidyma]|uniref:NAD(P)-binding domain-containing protein n=1 Tax=Dactylonectria macrodidyma TaxID=307937 RepID=A0A9P9INQ0_9HYPO|nr:hypothetical protein EDB81DRAFT_871857 [Dactylonectria macrodidyma]